MWWAEDFGWFKKKQFVKIWSWTKRVDFLDLGAASPVGSTRCWVRWNSQHSQNCVSLSSCWKHKSQEGNKSFVPELQKVVSVSGFPMYISHIHILVLFWWLYYNNWTQTHRYFTFIYIDELFFPKFIICKYISYNDNFFKFKNYSYKLQTGKCRNEMKITWRKGKVEILSKVM